MENNFLQTLLNNFKNNKINEDEFLKKIKKLFIHDIGIAKLDHFREERTGIPEVIFCKDKTKKQVLKILENLIKLNEKNYLFSRLTKKQIDEFKKINDKKIIINQKAKSAIFKINEINQKKGNILILTAGTSDLEAAEESKFTLKYLGYKSEIITDVGISGIHRLFDHIEILRKAEVIIVMAGMEGALPTLVGSLVKCPVIAVPISSGYGTSFNGITALLAMLNSCTPGLTVVNIDNGFGAACAAAKILNNKYEN